MKDGRPSWIPFHHFRTWSLKVTIYSNLKTIGQKMWTVECLQEILESKMAASRPFWIQFSPISNPSDILWSYTICLKRIRHKFGTVEWFTRNQMDAPTYARSPLRPGVQHKPFWTSSKRAKNGKNVHFQNPRWPPVGHFGSNFHQYQTCPRFYGHTQYIQIWRWSDKNCGL